jgi:hypothetical protein
MIPRVEVHIFSNSSNILRADFDPLVDVMTVYFKGGSIYQFVAVPYTLFEEFKKAESAGKFFTQFIKGKFDHLKH